MAVKAIWRWLAGLGGMVLAVALLAAPAAAAAADRVALVIGNATYYHGTSLRNPGNDAALVKQSLEQAGFAVTVANNLDRTAFAAALEAFRKQAKGAKIGLVYYGGHGLEAMGENWLVPIDAELTAPADLARQAIPLEQVFEALRGAELRLVFLDACRVNSFGDDWTRGVRGQGLAKVEVQDIAVLYSAGAGQVARDGRDGNSPFARAVAARLVEPGLMVQLMGNRIRDDVIAATKGEQRPFLADSITGTPAYLVQPLGSMPATYTGNANTAQLVFACDRAAGADFDPERPPGTPSVSFDAIEPSSAIDACSAAQAAAPKEARIQFELGRAYQRKGDFAAARSWYEKAAKSGYSAAMLGLGVLYEGGSGVKQDYKRARAYYDQAQKKGNAGAYAYLGNLYFFGHGVKQDPAAALVWFRKGAEASDAGAMKNLGYLYESGTGVAQDYAEALSWYRQAASKRDTGAMNALGALYYRGAGVKQDFREALFWFDQATRAGDALAMNNLGNLYYKGEGVRQDYATAFNWYAESALRGLPDGMTNLGELYAAGEGTEKDYARAKLWWDKSAALGDRRAMALIGYLYEKGWGVPEDKALAKYWYDLSGLDTSDD